MDAHYARKLAERMGKEVAIFGKCPIGDTIAGWEGELRAIAEVLQAQEDQISALITHHAKLIADVKREANKWTFIAAGLNFLKIAETHE